MQKINSEQKPKRRRGPPPRPAAEIRTTRISVYLTDVEAFEIRQRAAGRNPAAYLRSAVLSRLPVQVPEINRQAYVELSRAASNLNQIAHSLNILWQEGGLPGLAEIEDIRQELTDFRIKLLGLKALPAMPEGEEE